MRSEELSCRQWSEQDFENSRLEWNALMAQANADPLFLSWSWLYRWWQQHKTANSSLSLYAVYKEGMLVGLAPLYLERDAYARGTLRTTRLQFIGKRLSEAAGIRSEYINFIVHRDYEQPVLDCLLSAIDQDATWSELAFFDLDSTSALYQHLQKWPSARSYHYRHELSERTYRVDCRGFFKQYLAALGSNTRLKLYNRRKLLEQKGTVELVPLSEQNWPILIEYMQRWHQERWSRLVLGDNGMSFLREVTSMQALRDSSLLMLDGEPVSVMMNVRVGTTVYNIQLAFRDNLDKRISMGTLHLGYVIEQMFLDPDVGWFDLLAGTGKHSNYKSHIAGEGPILVSARWIRGRPLKWVFQVYDRYLRD